MKISHKRKVQLKLQKHIKAAKAAVKKEVQLKAPKAVKPAVETKVKAAPKAEAAPKVVAEVALTPKQQQVLDIVRQNAEGINLKVSVWQQARKSQKPHLGQLQRLRSWLRKAW